MKTARLIVLVAVLLPALTAMGQEKKPIPRPKPLTLPQKLEAEVNLNFEDTPIREALNFLAQFADVTVLTDPEVFKEKSLDELLVTLRAESITIRNTLELITLTKNLAWDLRWGGVFIGTEKRLEALPKTVPNHFPTAEDRALLRRLNETVTYQFDETPVTNALEFIRTLKSVNIVVDDQILNRAEETLVSQSVSGIPIRGALNALLLPGGLTWEVHQGVVFVRKHLGTEEPTWEQSAAKLLANSRVDLDLKALPLVYVIHHLAEYSQVPIYGDPALGTGSTDGPPVDLKVDEVSIKSALGLLATAGGLTWDLRWEGVFLTTPERQTAMPKAPLPPPARGAPTWELKLRERLQGHVSFAFDGTEMSQALEFLRTLWKLNIVVHPGAKESMDSLLITLRVNDMRLDYALAHLLFPHGLRFELTDEVVLITKAK